MEAQVVKLFTVTIDVEDHEVEIPIVLYTDLAEFEAASELLPPAPTAATVYGHNLEDLMQGVCQHLYEEVGDFMRDREVFEWPAALVENVTPQEAQERSKLEKAVMWRLPATTLAEGVEALIKLTAPQKNG